MAMDATATEMLKTTVERAEQINEDMASLKADLKEVFKEAKSAGLDVKILKNILRLRKKDKDELEEDDEVEKLYRKALGM